MAGGRIPGRHGGRWRAGALLSGLVALLVGLLAVVTNIGTELVPGSWTVFDDRRVVWSALALLVLTTAGLAVVQQRLLAADAGAPAGPVGLTAPALTGIARDLAAEALRRTHDSPVRMRLHRPMPLRVWFRSAERHLAAGRRAVTGDDDGDWESAPIHDHVASIAHRLRSLQWRQLAVLGEPGAGKSVLAVTLVHELLSDPGFRVESEPVPVLLPASAWNPAAESVARFTARRLHEDYGLPPAAAGLLATEVRPGSTGRFAGVYVMPVLDGLDEIAAELRPAAVAAIERYASTDRPVVLTCRTNEFASVVAATGVLARAAVVQLVALRVDDVVEYLSEPEHQAGRWHTVFAALRADPAGTLATALSTPLMAALAKDAYAGRDPAELATMPTRGEISGRLIDGYVTTVYDRAAARTAPAARWLGSLAYLADRDGSRDLRWWRLPWNDLWRRPRLARWMQLGGLGTAAAVVALGTAWAALGPGRAVALAGAAGLVVLLIAGGAFTRLFGHRFQPATSAVPLGLRRLARRAGPERVVRPVYGVLFGALCGLLPALLVDRPALAVVTGAASGLLSALLPGPRRDGRAEPGPAATLRANHRLAARTGLRFGGPAAVLYAGAGAAAGSAWPIWACTGLLAFAGAAALAGGEGLWLRFRCAHLALALWRADGGPPLLPVRLLAFIEDGAGPERNTLRVNGIGWQFRHALIHDHLAHPVRESLLRRRSRAGSIRATARLSELLRERGDAGGAAAVVRAHAARGRGDAAESLAGLLYDVGDADAALAVLLRGLQAGGRGKKGRAARYRAAERAAGFFRERNHRRALAGVWLFRADRGERYAEAELAELLHEHGDAGTLRRLTANGDTHAARHLAELLFERGDAETLREWAGAGSGPAAERLARLLLDRGDTAGAAAVWRRRADAGDRRAAEQLAELLERQGDVAGAVAAWRRIAHAGDDIADWPAAERLAELLARQGQLDGAIAVWERLASTGAARAAARLAELLCARGDIETLHRRAEGGDVHATRRLALYLRDHGDPAGAAARWQWLAARGDNEALGHLTEHLLRAGEPAAAIRMLARSAEDNPEAARRLADLLRDRGDIDGLRARADRGDGYAAAHAVALLSGRGDVDGVVAVLRRQVELDNGHAALQLADLLIRRGARAEAIAVWVRRADAGDGYAAERAAELLVESGDLRRALHIWQRRADAGSAYALERVAALLLHKGDVPGAIAVWRRRAEAGDGDAAQKMTELLREQGLLRTAIAFWRPRADLGDGGAARQLARLLREDGDAAVLRQMADTGDSYAADQLCGLLHDRDDADGLRHRVDVGDAHAAGHLAELLRRRGDVDGAIAVWRRQADAGDRTATDRLTELLRERAR
ncbi:hypothetical protein [Dactylosporangium sp. NPDC049140]|uniref:hypothetical protein n=1 Tax=Dactylosporangium sp. NPDC049140 TaxID=3155647 RepID=UPI0033F98341